MSVKQTCSGDSKVPADFAQLVATGRHLLENDHYPRAKEMLQAAYRINGRDREVLAGLALCCIKDDKPDAAMKYLNEALELNPDDNEIREKLGWVQFRMRSFADTIANCRSLLVDDPKNLEVSGYLGLALIGTDELDEAEGILLNVAGRSPTSVEARLGLAVIEGDRGNTPECARKFNQMMLTESKERGAYVWSLMSSLKPEFTEALAKWAEQRKQP